GFGSLFKFLGKKVLKTVAKQAAKKQME
uniref:Cupiennin-3b n=2 Tax=Cupiennius salei TaxID=6928 RepID=TXC3B_CUPSA|nr:RecName: Full=Cupiennin-3b; Short=Cu-3b; AltName: Full=Short cationic peptide-3b; Short=SCP-3b [Cupiennius salei]